MRGVTITFFVIAGIFAVGMLIFVSVDLAIELIRKRRAGKVTEEEQIPSEEKPIRVHDDE